MIQTDVKIPWPNWEIAGFLGGGSFGAVYEIERRLFDGDVTERAAVKVISIPKEISEVQELLSSGYKLESINERYLQDLQDIAKEYSMMAKLKGNANIVYCDDLHYERKADGIGWTLYIKMELLTPLNKALPDTIQDGDVVKLAKDLCNALAACKKNNIIHRDIKPANIMVAADGNYKLGDFGVAKTMDRTTGGTKTGTYNYMAPEVYNNQPYGMNADIYSLGMVMYWMLNERCGPFLPLPPTVPTAMQLDEAKQRRFSGDPLPAPVHGSAELKNIVMKACAYDPAQRYDSPEALAYDLAKIRVQTQSRPVGDGTEKNAFRKEESVSDDDRSMGNSWGGEYEKTQGSVHTDRQEQGGTIGGDSDRHGSQLGPYDVKQTITITPQDAKTGCKKLLAFSSGKKISVNIPPNTANNTTLRLAGAGNQDPATGARGNAFVQILVSSAEEDVFARVFQNSEPAAQYAGVISTSQARSGCSKTFTFKDGTKKTIQIPANCKDLQVVDGVTIYVHDRKSKPENLDKLPDAVVEMYANQSTHMGRNILLWSVFWMIFGMSTLQIPIMAGGLMVSIVIAIAVGVKKGQTIQNAKLELTRRERKHKTK